jgi:predicted outer membrane repeat protein
MNHNRLFNHCLICVLIFISGLGLALTLPWLANSQSKAAYYELDTPINIGVHRYKNSLAALPQASDAVNPNPPSPTCFATHDNGATTPYSSTNATAVQQAVDAASPGDTVKIAGTCAGVQIRAGLTQTVYISKSLTLEGGHTQTNWSLDPEPDTYTTTLDASGGGRVIVITGMVNVTLDGLSITGGLVVEDEPLDECGGGIWSNSSMTLTNSIVISNTALTGGGMCNRRVNPTISNVTFSENSAVDVGGAMYNDGYQGESSPILTNVTFSGNSAGDNGGAMFNLAGAGESSPVLTNVTFFGNNAGDFGGAMCNIGYGGESSPELTNVTFSSNTAGENGGGMYNSGSGPTVTGTFVILSNNSIGLGRAIANNGYRPGISNPKLTNVTFSGNSAGDYGGAIFNAGFGGESSPEMNNSILWNNKDSSGTGTISATIFLTGSATTTLTHSLVEGAGESGINWIGGDYKDGGGNIDEAPLFIEPIFHTTAPTTTGNLRLLSNSPAIDNGDNSFVSVLFDLDNEPRIKDGNADGTATVDMGAYETKGYFQLSVTKTGTGGGQVTSTPAGINCGNTCSEFFLEDSSITLIATPDGNSTFTDWGGVCSGTGDCVVTMDGAKNVTANFETNPLLSVYLSGSGAGTVTSTPKGIACGTDCSQIYPYGTQVKLLADAGPYSAFKGWSGACNGSGDCVVTMDGAKNVTANFETKQMATTLYLPILLDSESIVLKGRITDRGAPVQVKVELRYFDGSNWSTYRTANTNSSGEYLFGSLPILSGNQSYYVRFVNVYDNESWLTAWGCWEITPTTTDPSLSRCDFDIENVFQISPNPGATVPLPQDFTWTTRITTSDSYIFSIADMSDYDPHARTDPLGYVGGVTITGLPPGFVSGKEYGWWLEIISSEGLGFSYYYFDVTFQQNSDPSYPTVCIPPPPPDLDCSDIPYKNFKVLPPYPHNFDGDGNGIRREIYRSNLDPSNPTYYLTPQSQDLDYVDIPYKFYRDITPGPQPFNGDGIGCESWP